MVSNFLKKFIKISFSIFFIYFIILFSTSTISSIFLVKVKVLNKKIVDLKFPLNAIIGCVIRGGIGLVVLGGFEIQIGDRVLVCSKPDALKKVESLFL